MLNFPAPEGKTCIVGIGNTLCSDDGAGALLCSLVETMNLPGVTTLTVPQLDIDLIEVLLAYDCIILVDAAVSGGEVEFDCLLQPEVQEASSSHYTNIHLLNQVAKKFYGRELPLFLCTIRGDNFEIGEILSDRAAANLDTAVQLLCDWIMDRPNIFLDPPDA